MDVLVFLELLCGWLQADPLIGHNSNSDDECRQLKFDVSCIPQHVYDHGKFIAQAM